MKEYRRSLVVDVLVGAVLLGVAALIAYVRFGMAGTACNDYLIRRSAQVVDIALLRYSEKHAGSYPPDSGVTGGGNVNDSLIRSGILRRYPTNYCSGTDSRMKRVDKASATKGDFSYRRHPTKPFEYEFVVYGTKSVVFKHSLEAMMPD